MKKTNNCGCDYRIIITQKNFLMMKFTLLLVLSSVLQLSASVYSQNTRFNFKVEQGSVKSVLDYIEENSKFRLFYEENVVDVERKVSLTTNDESIEEILTELFRGEDISWDILDNNFIVLVKKENGSRGALQQPTKISGKVTNIDGEPVPGATVLIKGTLNGTVTDADGNFTLSGLPENAVLAFSFVGMKTQEIAVGRQSSLTVKMEFDSIGLEEVIAVGYGTMKKSDLTGSISSVSESTLAEKPTTNVLQALQGNMPGLLISNNSNTASGEDLSILVRGQNSIKAGNNPLIIVDGIPFAGSIGEINPSDIQSVELLKDASSCAIYGSRGANGVILITTKTGKTGKPTIRYNGRVGIGVKTLYPKLMDGDQLIKFRKDYATEIGASTELSNILSETELEQYNKGEEVDWWDLTTDTGKEQEHLVSVSGANEKVNYYVSGSYINRDWVWKGDKYSRTTFRVNLDLKVTDWLTYGTNSQYAFIDNSGYMIYEEAPYLMSPWTKPYNDDGSINFWSNNPNNYYSNPLSLMNIVDDEFNERIFVNNYLDVKIPFIPGLKYKINYGNEINNYKHGEYWGRDTDGYSVDGTGTITTTKERSWILENLLTYDKSIDKHTINVTGLYSAQEYRYETAEITGTGFVNDGLAYHGIESAETVVGSSELSEWSMISYMGRLNYNYDDRYLLTFTGRSDGYSGFGNDNKYAFFPSAALGWNIAEESFMSDIHWLDQLKLRLSYGENGNQAIDPYQSLSSMGLAMYLGGESGNDAVAGYLPSSLENAELGWETTKSKNFGIDFAVFNGRLKGTIDAYRSNTYDLLLDRTISPTHGISSISANIGETKNQGLEIALSSVNINNPNFKWTTQLNFSTNRNEIVDLYGDGNDDITNKWFIGEPINVIYDYDFIGVWQEGDDFENAWQEDAEPGDPKYLDYNKNGEWDSEDRYILGKTDPDWIGGMVNTFKYKNFTLSVYIYTRQGGLQYNYLIMRGFNQANLERGNQPALLRYWTPENPINDSPAYTSRTKYTETNAIQDQSFIKLQDVTLSYNLPKSLLSKIGLKDAKVYLNGKNLGILTDFDGYDPEFNFERLRPSPQTAVYTFGINVAF